MKDMPKVAANLGKFQDRFVTSDGSQRASVQFSSPQTLWFNTGTLCNIECQSCYILSSPTNDALVYLTTEEVNRFLDQISEQKMPISEIGFTGGEPFMNPDMPAMARAALEAGFNVLILTNAMRPMMRKSVRAALVELNQEFPARMTLRVSLDHFSAEFHDEERGAGSYAKTVEGLAWLRDNKFAITIAGRSMWGETEEQTRQGFATLFQNLNLKIDAYNPAQTVIFPEMDETVDVPEITTACWGILNKSPTEVMCASSRMVVKRKGASNPVVVACTLLPYEEEFELGETLDDARQEVFLNHPHCAKFCVLGGASCSA